MNKIINFYVIIIVLLVTACKSDTSIEQMVYNSLLNPLLDKGITDYRGLNIPSPNSIVDTISKQTRLSNAKNERLPLIIRINDSLQPIKDLQPITSILKRSLSKSNFSDIKQEFLKTKGAVFLNIETIESDNKTYEIVYASSISDKMKLSEIDKERLSGTCFLSRIYFNENNTIGVFTLDVVYGKLNASGSLVIIKKIDDLWVIESIQELWIS